MDEASTIAEKKFNAEKQRLIGEALLRSYALFLDRPYGAVDLPNRNDVTATLVALEGAPIGSDDSSALTRSDNKTLSRITRSLVATCDEIDALKSSFDACYEHFASYEDATGRARKHSTLASALAPLHEAHGLARRAQLVVVVTLRQLCALLGRGGGGARGSAPLFPEVLHPLGDLLVCLLKLDHVLDSPALREHWFLYRKSVRTLRHSGGSDLDERRLRSFDRALARLEDELLPCTVLKDVMRRCLDDREFYVQAKGCGLSDEIQAFASSLAGELERNEECFEPESWWKLNVYVAFYSVTFGTFDRKLLRRVNEVNRRLSACTLIGNVVWYPERFLAKHTTLQVDEKSARAHRAALVQNVASNFSREANGMCAQACACLIELKRLSEADKNRLQARQLQDVANLLTVALRLAKRLRLTVDWMLNLHADNDLPMAKSVLLSVCRLIEALKCLEGAFRRDAVSLAYVVLLIRQHLQHRALSALAGVRSRFTQERSYKGHQLDVLSALAMCERSLRRLDCARAPLVAALSLSASDLGAGAAAELRAALAHLAVFATYAAEMRKAADCSALFWHFGYVLPAYFGRLVVARGDVSRYRLVLEALSDYGARDWAKHKSVLDRIISEDLYRPIAQLVESNLRLQTHLHLHLPPVDPFDSYFPLNFRKYQPAPLGGAYKSIRDDVEHQLSETFYNLTSVVLYDWRTYGEMRRLAHAEYGLSTVDDDLPMQTLEQGLDVLEIMRNIDVFVGKYLYNLNSQVFVERDSGNKYLNSIGITHVANSIRTHGTGIMNTTVNFTYQFLREKFYVFSQFIFDEQIKSRLIQDRKYYNAGKSELGQMYPYARAEKFNVGIRKLGLNERGESYLDLFRGVVTHIGNAMGYVRLIRSGGRRCLAEAASFVPDLTRVSDLVASAESEPDMPELTRRATAHVVDSLRALDGDIGESTEYFKLLVDVFVPVLRSKGNRHLRYFHVIVPPLTINYVEHMLNARERLSKRDGYAFTDDGFSLGLAYVVEVLDQGDDLEALHWFQSVRKKIEADRRSIEAQLGADSNDEKLKQALNLSMRKVSALEREFKLLYYGFNSARLFFHQGSE